MMTGPIRDVARFAGRGAVVTGAASGVGAASAQRLSAQGAVVVLVDVNFDEAQKVAASLAGPAMLAEGDVSVESDVEACIAQGVERFGRIDLHHLNAGIVGTFHRIPNVSVDDSDKVIGVNLRGTFLGIRSASRQYAAQGSGGSIVLTALIASLRGSHDLLPYQTLKHVVLDMMRGAAKFGGSQGSRVNAAAPGLVSTGLLAKAVDLSGGVNDMTRRGTTVPQRRTGRPEEGGRRCCVPARRRGPACQRRSDLGGRPFSVGEQRVARGPCWLLDPNPVDAAAQIIFEDQL